jgi:hypothetical protein
VIVSSASSKTAWAIGHLLRSAGISLIGLTSRAHRDLVTSLGCYGDVIAYEDVDDLAAEASVYVDVAGSARIRTAVRARLGARLAYDCAIGVTHHQEQAPPEPWDGPEPEVFFAPSRFVRLLESHGAARFWSGYGSAWRSFLDSTAQRLRLRELNGVDALAAAYRAFVRGDIDPALGVVVRI